MVPGFQMALGIGVLSLAAVEKRPSNALSRYSGIIAAYAKGRLILHGFARLASGHF
jgi:hypothetical protein